MVNRRKYPDRPASNRFAQSRPALNKHAQHIPAQIVHSPTDRAYGNTDLRREADDENFICKVCGETVLPEGAGSRHRNHCPKCLSSVHVDIEPGDRLSPCKSVMEPISVWVRKDGEWALIHRCKACGALSSNRIAADDNPLQLMSIAVKPLAQPPFPLINLEKIQG